MSNMSKGQFGLGKVLKAVFPNYHVYPEYSYYEILYHAIKRGVAEKGVYTQHHLKLGRRYKADWVVLELKLAFEFQGQQHYRPVAFGGHKDTQDAQSRFLDQRFIDRKKREIIREAGWELIEVPYYAEVTEENVRIWCENNRYTDN